VQLLHAHEDVEDDEFGADKLHWSLSCRSVPQISQEMEACGGFKYVQVGHCHVAILSDKSITSSCFDSS
jgi:hypothetical protein